MWDLRARHPLSSTPGIFESSRYPVGFDESQLQTCARQMLQVVRMVLEVALPILDFIAAHHILQLFILGTITPTLGSGLLGGWGPGS